MTRCPDWVSVTTRTPIGLPCLISNSNWPGSATPSIEVADRQHWL
jgi:hypothetical protein